MAEPTPPKVAQDVVQPVVEQQTPILELHEKSAQDLQTIAADAPPKYDDNKDVVVANPDLPVPTTDDEKTIPQAIIPLKKLEREPALVQCPSCSSIGVTRIELVAGPGAKSAAAVLCCLIGVLGVWIPFVVSSCKDVEHRCSTCNVHIVTVAKDGEVEIKKLAAPQPVKQG